MSRLSDGWMLSCNLLEIQTKRDLEGVKNINVENKVKRYRQLLFCVCEKK